MKSKYYTLSFSGGKDSTALLLKWLENCKTNPDKYQLDEVIHCTTGKDFPVVVEQVNQIKKIVENSGIKFTVITPPRDFDDLMFNAEKKPFKNEFSEIPHSGYGWPTNRVRWCTGDLKTNCIKRYLKQLKQEYEVYQIIGLCADEVKRLNNKNAQDPTKIYPLVEWNMTEADCLQYCYDHGYDFGGLYEKLDRVSCYCCPLKNLKELRIIYKEMPEVWEMINEMDKKAWNCFKNGMTVEELGKRFDIEDDFLEKGESIRSKKFYTKIREEIPWFRKEIFSGIKPEYLKKYDLDLYNKIAIEKGVKVNES